MSGRDIIMGEYVGRKLSMSLRRNWLTRPIFNWARRALPTMSDTERDALEDLAGKYHLVVLGKPLPSAPIKCDLAKSHGDIQRESKCSA